ncbi:MAG: glutathione S-transferase family protein [Myxococcota bacterium]
MIRLYHAPRTRSARIVWLLEELELPYRLERVEFQPPARRFFGQSTPTGKLPTLVDGDLVMCESGAILEYVLERYAAGRLAPAVGSAERGPFLQWIHYAESTAFPPLGILVWLTIYREDAADHPAVIQDARGRASMGFDFLEEQLGDREYLLASGFSGADIMMGFTLIAARLLGVLDDRYPALGRYATRLSERPAFQRALAVDADASASSPTDT